MSAPHHSGGTGPRPASLHTDALHLPPGHSWHRLPTVGLTLAAVGLGGSLAFGLLGGTEARHQLWHSWLVGSLFVLGISLGALFFVLVQHATQAGWSIVVRRLAENVMGALPYLALLFVPLAVLGLGDLFHWSHPEAVQSDPLLQHKAAYLNVPFFLIRTFASFAIWSVLAVWFSRQSRLQDETGDHEITRRMRRRSAPALILFALTVTFFAFDWLMSLDPHWYSTIFGLYFFAGSVMSFFAVLALVALAAKRQGLLTLVLSDEHQHDVGKLLFAFVAFWAYMAFSQYLLIWYANLPEETSFFAKRMVGTWSIAGTVLALGHFIVPFFFLLPRTIKRNATALRLAALWLLAMHLLDLHWLVMPNLHPAGMAPGLLDALTLIGCCGVFLAAFGGALKRRALVPLRDPRLPESLTFENV
ncbi:MAG TPA: quinol:cytochrome C oxidoreductase [Acidobacteria bacterium]|nr:quinol:cytochrome C oxidoreductase [Acidobacteriota bacterium]